MKKLIPLLILLFGLQATAQDNASLFFPNMKEGYDNKIGPGQMLTFKVCANKELSEFAKNSVFPNDSTIEFPVKFTWKEYLQGGEMLYQPWAGQTDTLPLQTKLSGPLSGGVYCSPTLVVKYSHFPSTGAFEGNACINNVPDYLCKALYVAVYPKPQQVPPPPLTKPKSETLDAGPAQEAIKGLSTFGAKVPNEAAGKRLPSAGVIERGAAPPASGSPPALTPPRPIVMPNARAMPKQIPPRTLPETGAPAVVPPDAAPQVAAPARTLKAVEPVQPENTREVTQPAEIVRQAPPAAPTREAAPTRAAPLVVPRIRDASPAEAQPR